MHISLTSPLKGSMGPLGESAAPFQFTGRQQSVHIAIAGKSIALAELYESALRSLHDVGNPGRLFLAGHCIREMTNGLPKVLDVPILTSQARMGDQVNALEPVWDSALKGECFKDGRWSGTIDGPLERLVRRLHEFFRWLSENRPKRRHVAVNLFRNLDPAGIPLPKALEKQRVDLWLELHDYFV